MHSAFRACTIAEIPKERIEVIFAYGDKLLVGTAAGTLRVYEVQEPNDEFDVSATLLKTVEKFAKKIEQLAIIKESGLLVVLADSVVSLHDLNTLELQEQLTKTKGATGFAITSNVEKDSDGVPTIVSRIAISVKRKIFIYSWNDAELLDVEEFSSPDRARSLTWMTSTKLCLGFSSDYAILDTSNGIFSEAISPAMSSSALGTLGGMGVGIGYLSSRAPPPLSVQLPDNLTLLVKDTLSAFLTSDGKPVERRQIPWKQAPEKIGYTYPYLIALTTKEINIWNPALSKLIQRIELHGANLLNDGKLLYVASPTQIWRLVPYPYDSQIDELVSQKLYDEALSLLNQVEDVLLKNKEIRIRTITYLKAYSLFEQKKYEDAMQLFSSVSATPKTVVGLFPAAIAGEWSQSVEPEVVDSEVKLTDQPENGTPGTPSIASAIPEVLRKDTGSDTSSILSQRTEQSNAGSLDSKDLTRAILSLIQYLADMRFKLSRWLNTNAAPQDDNETEVRMLFYLSPDTQDPAVECIPDLEFEDAAVIVDTTLFRAYMLRRPQLVGPLVRRPNRCIPSVVQEMLERAHKYRDLAEFLLGKGLHRQALQLLQDLGKKTNGDDDAISVTSPSIYDNLQGPDHTILYLQKLKGEDIDLILEFIRWPLEENEELAMEVFLGDTPEAESLPRERVVDFLANIKKALAIHYLEHLIQDLNDMTPSFHDRLISLYLDEIANPSTPLEQRHQTREKLENFLEESTQYVPERILARLPNTETFLSERAILLSKMGQHKSALEIYIFKLKDYNKAENYCIRVYSQAASASTPYGRTAALQVFHTLLTLYLTAKPTLLGPGLDILAKHSPRLDASQALALIPPDIPVDKLESFFTKHIRKETSAFNEARIVSELRRIELLRMETQLMRLRHKKAVVTEESACPYCHKRLGQSVVAVIPRYSLFQNSLTSVGQLLIMDVYENF